MILLDTDALTLLFQGHPRVKSRVRSAESDVATTFITWIEVMQGRFDAILKAADADQLERAHQRLKDSARQLATLTIVPINRRGTTIRQVVAEQEAQEDQSRRLVDCKHRLGPESKARHPEPP